MSFLSIDEVHSLLDEIAETIPEEFYYGLNGGITLLEEYKLHPESCGEKVLYVLGEYATSPIGNSIRVFYGSLERAFSDMEEDEIYEKLREILLHEFTHHLENLSGENGLVVEDRIAINKYKEDMKKNK